MLRIMEWIGVFAANRVRDFRDIYVDEEQIRESYGNEYADRFSAVDPSTGRRRISALKVATRIVIVFIVIFWIIVAVRMAGWL